MGPNLPSRAGTGGEAGAKAAFDASPGRSGWPRGLGEAAEAVGLDERVQRPTQPNLGPESWVPRAVVWAAEALQRRKGGSEGKL